MYKQTSDIINSQKFKFEKIDSEIQDVKSAIADNKNDVKQSSFSILSTKKNALVKLELKELDEQLNYLQSKRAELSASIKVPHGFIEAVAETADTKYMKNNITAKLLSHVNEINKLLEKTPQQIKLINSDVRTQIDELRPYISQQALNELKYSAMYVDPIKVIKNTLDLIESPV